MDLLILIMEYQTGWFICRKHLFHENFKTGMSSRCLVHGGDLSQTCSLPASTHDEHEGTAHMVWFHKERCSINKGSALKFPDLTSIIIKSILSDSSYGTIDGM